MENNVPINATCPECRGPLSQEPGSMEIRCLVGHTYSPLTLLQAHYETQERVLWSAVVALEEATPLVDAVAPFCSPEAAARLKQQAATKLRQAKDLRAILERLEPFRPD
jgi:LSD1 subclass zinc finger protein